MAVRMVAEEGPGAVQQAQREARLTVDLMAGPAMAEEQEEALAAEGEGVEAMVAARTAMVLVV